MQKPTVFKRIYNKIIELANKITDEIYIRNSDLNKKDFRKTLLHEINHYIQHKENYDKRSR